MYVPHSWLVHVGVISNATIHAPVATYTGCRPVWLCGHAGHSRLRNIQQSCTCYCVCALMSLYTCTYTFVAITCTCVCRHNICVGRAAWTLYSCIPDTLCVRMHMSPVNDVYCVQCKHRQPHIYDLLFFHMACLHVWPNGLVLL